MIHRESRDRLAKALRAYTTGQINNDELAATDIDIDWRDRGAVYVWEMAWNLYDDTKAHFATGKHALPKETKRQVAQWIVFLQSDKEYLWPEYSFMQIVNWPMNLLTFGWWERQKKKRWAEYMEAGDFSAWPFSRHTELDEARKNPRFLRGNTHIPEEGE